MPSSLQTHSAPTWLTQSVSFEDYEAICVGHQQIKTKVKACPAPAVLWRRTFMFDLRIRINKCTLNRSKRLCIRNVPTHISIFSEFPATPHAAQLKLIFVCFLGTDDRQEVFFNSLECIQFLWLYTHVAAAENYRLHYKCSVSGSHPLSLSNSVRSIANHWFLYTDVSQSGKEHFNSALTYRKRQFLQDLHVCQIIVFIPLSM